MRLQLILYAVLTYSRLYTQSTFSTIYNYTVEQGWPDPGGGGGYSLFETDTGFVVYGGQVAANFRTKAFQDIYSSTGQHLRHVKYFPTDDVNGAVSSLDERVISSSAPEFLIHTSFIGGSSSFALDLIRIGLSGDTVFTIFIEDTNNVNFGTLIKDDGTIVLSGQRWTPDTLFGGSFLHIDTSGIVLISKQFPQYLDLGTARATADNGYVLSATNWSGEKLILKLDSIGDVDWEHLLPGEQRSPSLEITADNGYLVASKLKTSFDYGNVWLRKIDPTGAEIWTQVHDEYQAFTSMSDIEILDDGTSVCVFGAFDHIHGYFAAILMKFDTNGNILWQQGVRHPDYLNYWYRPNDLIITADGGFSIVGVTSWGPLQQSPHLNMTWLAKTDSLGCITPGCQTVGIEEQEVNALHVHPNPFSDHFTINTEIEEPIESVALFDALGREHPISFGPFLNAFKADVPSGIYLLRIQLENGSARTTRLVKK